MDNQRLILFAVFSFSILMLWEAWTNKDAPVTQPASVTAESQTGTPRSSTTALPTGTTSMAASAAGNMPPGLRAIVETDVYRVEIDANGGDLRKLELIGYHNLDAPEQPYLLLDDAAAPRDYIVQSGLLNPQPGMLPTHKDVFQLAGGIHKMTGDSLSVPLVWQNPQTGVRVEKIYTFHRGSYVIDVEQKITNGGSAPLQVEDYAQLVRDSEAPPDGTHFMNTFTGPAVYTEEAKFQKVKFKSIADGDASFQKTANNGWIGILQHHFVVAWLPKQGEERRYFMDKIGDDLYSAGYRQVRDALAPGQTLDLSSRLYAGPQIEKDLEAAAPGLDLTRDYGWLTPLSKPIFWVLSKIHKFVGNWGWTIIIFTILLKVLLFPLSASGYKGMAQMRALTPRLQKLKEIYGDDRQKLHEAMAEIYKKEKVNPLGGCMPILLQIPVFIALYYALIAAVEMRGAPWIGWITDLSAPDPYYVLPILMGISSIIQVKLNPTPPDPIQANVMMAMPVMFSIMFIFFASGLVLYWLVNNIMSIAQQWVMIKRYGRTPSGANSAKS